MIICHSIIFSPLRGGGGSSDDLATIISRLPFMCIATHHHVIEIQLDVKLFSFQLFQNCRHQYASCDGSWLFFSWPIIGRSSDFYCAMVTPTCNRTIASFVDWIKSRSILTFCGIHKPIPLVRPNKRVMGVAFLLELEFNFNNFDQSAHQLFCICHSSMIDSGSDFLSNFLMYNTEQIMDNCSKK